MRRIPRYDIYTDRRSERDLCHDFPADESIIHGLHLMQAYLWARGATIDIPVVRVMNTAHYLATYMLSTPCTDRTEYDMRVYCDLGCDRQLAPIAIIALAAMLQRIDNPRAKTCRSALLEDRSEDFYEGLSMYEQWLAAVCDRDGKSEHYSDEDFQIDVMDELTAAKQQIQYLQNKLQKQLSMKEENHIKHIGYNVENMTINMSGGTLVQHADLVQASGEVVVEQHADIENKQPKDCQQPSFCVYLVPEKIAEMGICTMEQAEAELRAESEKDAKHFAAYLRKKEKAGTLYFHGDTKKQIFATLQAHFPNMKRYTYNNFIAYF